METKKSSHYIYNKLSKIMNYDKIVSTRLSEIFSDDMGIEILNKKIMGKEKKHDKIHDQRMNYSSDIKAKIQEWNQLDTKAKRRRVKLIIRRREIYSDKKLRRMNFNRKTLEKKIDKGIETVQELDFWLNKRLLQIRLWRKRLEKKIRTKKGIIERFSKDLKEWRSGKQEIALQNLVEEIEGFAGSKEEEKTKLLTMIYDHLRFDELGKEINKFNY